jgi:hypothetical protein
MAEAGITLKIAVRSAPHQKLRLLKIYRTMNTQIMKLGTASIVIANIAKASQKKVLALT